VILDPYIIQCVSNKIQLKLSLSYAWNQLLDFDKEEEKSNYGGNSHPLLVHMALSKIKMILFFIMSNIHHLCNADNF
jgi:hypothetical protein